MIKLDRFLRRFAYVLPIAILFLGSKASAATEGWDLIPEILKRIVPPTFPSRDFKVTDYGAVANGTNDSSAGIKAAIVACNKAGGGRVVIPTGTYKLDGPIHL